MSLRFEGENAQTVDNEHVFECLIYASPILSLSLSFSLSLCLCHGASARIRVMGSQILDLCLNGGNIKIVFCVTPYNLVGTNKGFEGKCYLRHQVTCPSQTSLCICQTIQCQTTEDKNPEINSST